MHKFPLKQNDIININEAVYHEEYCVFEDTIFDISKDNDYRIPYLKLKSDFGDHFEWLDVYAGHFKSFYQGCCTYMNIERGISKVNYIKICLNIFDKKIEIDGIYLQNK